MMTSSSSLGEAFAIPLTIDDLCGAANDLSAADITDRALRSAAEYAQLQLTPTVARYGMLLSHLFSLDYFAMTGAAGPARGAVADARTGGGVDWLLTLSDSTRAAKVAVADGDPFLTEQGAWLRTVPAGLLLASKMYRRGLRQSVMRTVVWARVAALTPAGTCPSPCAWMAQVCAYELVMAEVVVATRRLADRTLPEAFLRELLHAWMASVAATAVANTTTGATPAKLKADERCEIQCRALALCNASYRCGRLLLFGASPRGAPGPFAAAAGRGATYDVAVLCFLAAAGSWAAAEPAARFGGSAFAVLSAFAGTFGVPLWDQHLRDFLHIANSAAVLGAPERVWADAVLGLLGQDHPLV